MKTLFLSVIIAVSMLGSAYTISKLFINIRHEQPLEVKGYAEKEVLSDMGAFSFSVDLKTSEFQTDYKKFSSIVEEIVRSLGENAPKDLQIEKQSIGWQQVFKKNENSQKTNEIDYYILSQEVKISSKDVNWIDVKSRSLMDFLSKGIMIKVKPPSFFISGLDDIKAKLIQDATSNGYRRAQLIAENSGAKIGKLSSARQGVIQITSPNSSEVSDWGIYDTNSIKKVVKVVVTLEYIIE